MVDGYLHQFLRALAFTVVIETTVLIATRWIPFFDTRKNSCPSLLIAGCLASSLTLPYLWFVASPLLGQGPTLKIVAEPLIYLVEGLFYAKHLNLRWGRALALSCVCNTASLAFGMIFYDRFIAS
jgi:hypothetical protein